MIVILIAIIFLLLGFIFCMWVVSRILGRIGYATHGEKGRKIGRKAPWIFLLAFAAYSVVEYVYVFFQVQHLCKKEAGVFVYVTPEQWKEENKDELDQIVKYEWEDGNKLAKSMSPITIDGIKYKPETVKNTRMTHYAYYTYGNKQLLINRSSNILLDNKTGKVLIKSVYFHAIHPGYLYSGFNTYRLWMSTIPSCRIYAKKSNTSVGFSKAVDNFLSTLKD